MAIAASDVLSNPTLATDIAVIRAYGAYSGVVVDLVAFDSDVRVSDWGDINENPGQYGLWETPLDFNGALTGGSLNLNMRFGDIAPGQVITKMFYTSFNGRTDGHDVIELRLYGVPLFDQLGYGVTTFDELMSHASYSNGDTYLDLTPTSQIILKNVAMEQLHAEDFIFGRCSFLEENAAIAYQRWPRRFSRRSS